MRGELERAGFDTEGDVIVLAPEHEVQNAKAEAKAAAALAAHVGYKKPKPLKVKRKSPPQGFLTWNEHTLEQLAAAQAEALTSRMRITHAIVLNVIARGEHTPGEALRTMRTLIFESHEAKQAQFAHARQALAIFRTLRESGIVELREGRLQLTEPLQANFALNQPLSLFAIAAIELLDPAATDYHLDVISVIEASLEDPRVILRAQEENARKEALAAMKAERIEYEQRICQTR